MIPRFLAVMVMGDWLSNSGCSRLKPKSLRMTMQFGLKDFNCKGLTRKSFVATNLKK